MTTTWIFLKMKMTWVSLVDKKTRTFFCCMLQCCLLSLGSLNRLKLFLVMIFFAVANIFRNHWVALLGGAEHFWDTAHHHQNFLQQHQDGGQNQQAVPLGSFVWVALLLGSTKPTANQHCPMVPPVRTAHCFRRECCDGTPRRTIPKRNGAARHSIATFW